MSQGVRARKQVYELTLDDLGKFPVWEFRLDKDGAQGQDEATVRPFTAPGPLNPAFVDTISNVYLQTDTDMKAVVQAILRSVWFQDTQSWYARYSWPAEFVIRAIKEMGWVGFSVDTARTPMTNMGQTLLEPPDVSGWDLGQSWFSSGSMLARMNFAATLAANQKFNLSRDAGPYRSAPDRVLAYFLDRLTPLPYGSDPYFQLLGYLQAGITWTGSDSQLNTKCAGLARLVVGSSEYQFV
jgi:hypothetical protein